MKLVRRRVASAASVVLLATLLPTTLGGQGAQATPTPDLFGDSKADPAAPARAERSSLRTFNSDALTDASQGDRVLLDLFADTSLAVLVTSTGSGKGYRSWVGRTDAGDGGTPGTFYATQVDDSYHLEIATTNASFTATQVDGSTYRVIENGPSPVPSASTDAVAQTDHRLGSRTIGGSAAGAQAGAADPSTSIDILVAYTSRAASEAGGETQIKAQIATGIAQANQAYVNSQITTRLNLVGTMLTSGPDSGTLATDIELGRVANPTDGAFDDIPPMRDALHADLVNVYFGGPSTTGTCGWGFYSTVPTPDPENGYSIQQAWCATGAGDMVFSHEVGHNLGADHDAGAGSARSDTAPYARGFVDYAVADPAKRITIMSYFTTCGCTQRQPYYSNPNVLFPADGRPMGSPLANNARVINEAAPIVANYRASAIYPGVPSITGTPAVGQTLSAAPGTWSGATAFTYQWLSDGVAIAGATASTLALTSAQANKTVTVTVTGTGTNYAPVSVTSPTGLKVARPGIAFKKPKLVGKPKAGHVLAVKVSTKVKNVSFKFVWYRGGKKIKGVRGPVYRLKATDRRSKFQVKVTAKKKGFAATTKRTKKVRIS